LALALLGRGFYDARMTKELVLPNDLAACHVMIRDMAAQLEQRTKERDAAERVNDFETPA